MQPLIKVTNSDSGVCLIELNTHSNLNELSTKMLQAIADELKNCQTTDSVKVVVLFGGIKSFSCGSNIQEMLEKSAIEIFEDIRTDYWHHIFNFKKPLIVAISRMALGSGLELALAGDYILASGTAVFGSPEVELGIMPGAGATVVLKKIVGKFKAFEILTSGKHYSAKDFYELGIVNQLVDEKNLLDESFAVAERLASLPRASVSLIKDSLRSSSDVEEIRYERALFSLISTTPDAKEGMSSYLNKRKPNFGKKD